MLGNQATATGSSCQESFRWSRAEILDALEQFGKGDGGSQRQFAQEKGIPQATFNYWQRHFTAGEDDPIAGFFCSNAGEQVLRHIVAAAIVVFELQGGSGVRAVGEFLALARLDRFVATSRGAL